jgi:hypothetical protein
LAATLALVALGAVATVTASAVMSRRARGKLLSRIREEWGNARIRLRHMEAIAGYFSSRAESLNPEDVLDDRTWRDLNMDEVFQRLDRTESTLGQQVLYHRLRARSTSSDVSDFETLVQRMSDDVDTRERAQIALAHLQSPAAYDIFWLTQPDAVERRRWHHVFPIVALAMFTALTLSIFLAGSAARRDRWRSSEPDFTGDHRQPCDAGGRTVPADLGPDRRRGGSPLSCRCRRRSKPREPGSVSTPSSASRRALISRPAANPVSAPVDPITRWHGAMIDTGFLPLAAPTARTARG